MTPVLTGSPLQRLRGLRASVAKSFALAAALMAASLSLFAQSDTPVMATALVPAIGTVDGANGVRWRTSLELRNDFASPVDVVLELPSSPDHPFWMTTIAGGDTVRFADVIAEAFGRDHAFSPLLISTSGRRSVTVNAAAFGVHGDQVTEPEPITPEYGGAFFPVRVLQGLSFSDEYRTNIGLANLSETRDATFTLALQRLPGRNIAVTRITVRPLGMIHSLVQTLFPLITKGDDFMVVVETTSAQTCAYASVIQNENSTARFVAPRVIAATINP